MKRATLNVPSDAHLHGRRVEFASLVSLRLEVRAKGNKLADATGFIDIAPDGPVLVSNRHVFTGRHQVTGKPLHTTTALPDEVGIWFRKPGNHELVQHSERLFDRDAWPRWREHPELKERCDIAALPLLALGFPTFPRTGYIQGLPVTRGPALVPTAPVAIVGYPFGKHTTGFPVWTTGSVASEIEVPYDDNLPVFLVDARTRAGQSGSPTLFRSYGGTFLSVEGATVVGLSVTYFLGIYSGRIAAESDIGMVWRAEAIADVVERGVRSEAGDPDNARPARA